MRTRMYGGVRGRGLAAPSYSIDLRLAHDIDSTAAEASIAIIEYDRLTGSNRLLRRIENDFCCCAIFFEGQGNTLIRLTVSKLGGHLDEPLV